MTAIESILFLSCLRGSERVALEMGQVVAFLSCLRGSELFTRPVVRAPVVS